MKMMAILLLLSFISMELKAQEISCLDKLLPYSRHSGLHLLTKEEWNDGKDTLDSENVKLALNSLVGGKLLCKTGEVIIKVQPVCQALIADFSQSNVCFLFTNLGYFIASRDKAKNVTFIFGKDKHFSEPTEPKE